MQLTKSIHKASYPELTRTERILLGPGPSMVHPRVLQAMAAPLVRTSRPIFPGDHGPNTGYATLCLPNLKTT